MKKQTICLALLVFFLAGSATFAFGQDDGPLDSGEAPQIQATLPVLNFQLILPLIFRPDPSAFVGPYGGSVVVILPDPNDGNVVYAGSYGAGVYKSVDAGLTWLPARVGLGNLWINSMAIDPQNSQVLYAGTYKDGVYKSTNGGLSWVKTSSGIQSSAVIYTIAVDPQNPSRVYIGTRGENTSGSPPWKGVLYRSENGGASWQAVADMQNIGGSDQQDWVYSLAVLPNDPSVVLAASHEHGPYRSTNHGQNWTAMTSCDGCTLDGSGRAVLFDPRNNSVALYGVWHRSGIFKSNDNGRNWFSSSSGAGDAKIYGMSIDPSDPNRSMPPPLSPPMGMWAGCCIPATTAAAGARAGWGAIPFIPWRSTRVTATACTPAFTRWAFTAATTAGGVGRPARAACPTCRFRRCWSSPARPTPSIPRRPT